MEISENPVRHEDGEPIVVMRNEPKLSEHEVDQKFNEMRLEFVPYIKQFVSKHELFKNESEVSIEFSHTGVSSIIAIIETPTAKWVLKIPRSKTFSAGEGQFLKVWEDAGVSVPHVVGTGELHGFSYTLMEFVDATTLGRKYSQEELLSERVYVNMGQVLRLMHSPKVDGYGFVVNDKPEFEAVEEWLEGSDMKTRFEYIHEHNLLEGLEDVLQKAIEVIKQHAQTERSTYCHDDYGPHNIFATDPITVFDANPKFNSGYYDLGRIKFADIASGGTREVSEQVLSGYFGEEKYDKDVLHAYTFLAFCMKCPYWHQTKRKKELETAKEYFRQHQI